MEGVEVSRPHEPFTVGENIRQLNAIDQHMVQLMKHTTTALNALTIPSSPESNQNTDPAAETTKPPLDPPAQKETFRSATDSFLTTLHTVDVMMKRQIFALEEAGIIDLAPPKRQETEGPILVAQPVLPSQRPNGVGAVGNIGAGWLNSRGTRVERDMESELWDKAKGLLKKEKAKNESPSD
ncbi:mediator complex [Fusarium heterosporum]|uniref:Mediator of RNA polymerase II transcription subunit 11 n=1 Tax=Fusarium heterosporum TaxID=42747 RepID=A0A8H5SSK8_FUSHE|nr:mediator complex [Fusarium heterosporum]